MGDTVGQINLGLDISQKAFNKQLAGISKSAESSVGGAFKGLGKKIGVALGAGAIVSFTKSCLDLGSDLAEVQNVVDTTFTTMSNQVNEFAKNAIKDFGLSETVAKNYMGVLGTMSKSMGFTESQAYDMAKAVTSLSGDVASFYNLSSDEAYNKLKAIWTGETEGLKSLGVMLTQTNLDQYALNNGFGKTTAKMTEQEKVMLRYQYTLSALGAAQGDFAKTSDSWANQVRVLSLRFDSLKATLGQGFINLFTPIIRLINTLMASLDGLAQKFVSFTELITGKSAASGAIGSVVSDMASSTDALSNSVGDLGTTAKKAAKEATAGLAGFDKLNNVSDSSVSSGDGAGAGGGLGSNVGLADTIAQSTEENATKINGSLQKVIDKAKELAEIFTDGFKIGFGDSASSFDTIKESIVSIGTSIKGIFTDPEVLAAGDNWVTTTVSSAGKIAGSFASVGTTIADFVTGSISTYFTNNSGFIKDKIITMLDVSARKGEILSNFTTAVADIFSVFRSDSAKQIGADLIAIFTNSGLSITTLVSQLGTDILDLLTSPIINNKDSLKNALQGSIDAIQPAVEGLKSLFSGSFESISDAYETYIKPAFDNIKGGLSVIVGSLTDAYNTYIQPVISEASKEFKELVETHLKPAFDKVIDCIGSVVKAVSDVWNTTIAPFISWLIDKAGPIVSEILMTMKNNVKSLFKTVSTLIGDTADFIKALVETIKCLFTGDLQGAFDGLKDMLGSFWQGVKDLFSGVGDFFKTAFSGAVSVIKTAFSPIGSWFKERWKDIKGAFSSVKSWFSNKFTSAWNAIKSAFSIDNVKTFFKSTWAGIKNVFTNVTKWFKDKFTSAWDAIKGVFEPVGDFFGDIWSTIKTKFTDIGSKIGDAVAGAFKSAVNWVLEKAINLINGFIGGLNTAIGIINKIPGVNIDKVEKLPVPALAQGGYVKPNTPQLAMIGDNRHQGEVVAPEDKLQQLLDKAVSSNNMSSLQMAELLAILRDILRVLGFINDKDNSVHIGDTELGKAVQRFAKSYKQSTGKEAF